MFFIFKFLKYTKFVEVIRDGDILYWTRVKLYNNYYWRYMCRTLQRPQIEIVIGWSIKWLLQSLTLCNNHLMEHPME